MAGICSAKIKSFPICVVGFIAGDDGEQREQFIDLPLDRRLLGAWAGCSSCGRKGEDMRQLSVVGELSEVGGQRSVAVAGLEE
jgi:hypothetical protein